MSQPQIVVGDARLASGIVHFDATVAGYAVKLQMSREFVEDNIGSSADLAKVQAYFADNLNELKKAAWARAYAHSTKDKTTNYSLGPVPYIGSIRAPFDGIIFED